MLKPGCCSRIRAISAVLSPAESRNACATTVRRRDAPDARREHLVYESIKPGPGGSVSLLLTPLELIERLAALIPQPRRHRHRYYGVLAPNAPLRAAVMALAVVNDFGYNAANGTYGDMVEMGVLDPTKVTRSALQNTASIAGQMLTTECMVAELPKDDSAGGGKGGGKGGGMGGMDM